jgi:hypothetical protein
LCGLIEESVEGIVNYNNLIENFNQGKSLTNFKIGRLDCKNRKGNVKGEKMSVSKGRVSNILVFVRNEVYFYFIYLFIYLF